MKLSIPVPLVDWCAVCRYGLAGSSEGVIRLWDIESIHAAAAEAAVTPIRASSSCLSGMLESGQCNGMEHSSTDQTANGKQGTQCNGLSASGFILA